MGHAWRAPNASYVRHYFIAGHAVTRLRERLENQLSATYRDDEDLANRIDQAVVDGVSAGHIETHLYQGKPSKVVSLRHTLNEELYAVVVRNKLRGQREAVVTLLTSPMVRLVSKECHGGGSSLGTFADVVTRKLK